MSHSSDEEMPELPKAPDPVPVDTAVNPHYHRSVTIGIAGEKPNLIDFEKPVPDPFIIEKIDLGPKALFFALLNSLFRQKALRIQVAVGGDWDAIKHVTEVRPLHSMLPPDQAAERMIADALGEPDELALRRTRDQPHTLWYWLDDLDPIPAPHVKAFDNADDAEVTARQVIADHLDPSSARLAWVKVFRSDNESYVTFHWPDGDSDE